MLQLTRWTLVLLALTAAGCRDQPDPAPPGPVPTSRPLTVTGIDSVLGMLDLGGPAADGSGIIPLPLNLRAAPQSGADTLVTVTRWQDVMAEEIGYESPALVVLRAADPWYLVSTHDSIKGWIELPEGGKVELIPELLDNRLTYLTAAWDGEIHAAPDPGSATSRPGIRDSTSVVSVEVRESRNIAGTLWLRVALHDRSPCFGTAPPRNIADGWVRAWTAGKPTVWYHSRGC